MSSTQVPFMESLAERRPIPTAVLNFSTYLLFNIPPIISTYIHPYRCADKYLARPRRKQLHVSVRMAWISFRVLSCRRKKLTARVSMLLKSRPTLTCFRACFLPGRATDLPAPRYITNYHCALWWQQLTAFLNENALLITYRNGK